MAKQKKGPVFRVTGLRAEQSDKDLNTALRATIVANLSDDERRLIFTTDIVPSCNDDMRRVALVEFQDGIPNFLAKLVANPLKIWQIETGEDDITFDQHFFGFTQLYTPTANRKITADIIAITGLDGHAYGSWRGKGNLGRMWLRDFLSKDMPYCRMLTYGYNSKLSSHGINKILDYGREFIGALKKVRSSEEARQRPLFFIAHSFGGLILAHCLIKSVQTHEDDHPTIATLYKATYGMLLFGIPHKGLVIDDMQKMLAGEDNHPRNSLLQQISKESDLLASQLVDFKNLIRDRKVVSFYETGQTRQLQLNTETKRWERTGGFVTAVDTDSSLLQLPDSLEEKLPVDADHSMIVKFDSKTDETYINALRRLRTFEETAPEVIALRFVVPISGPKPTIMIPFRRDPDFVGREPIIKNIFQLNDPVIKNHCRVALTGLGGVGKSQIAIEYAYRFRESSPHNWVFWVYAANSSRFEQGYRAIADKVEILGRDDQNIDILQAVYNWLADERHGQWLMILDNVDDDRPFFDQERPLEKFLPQTANGRLLVTSRNRTAAMNLVGSYGHIVQVEPMGEDAALALLKAKTSLDESNQDDAKALVQALEFIPLAITHAAAYIKARALTTISEYLKRFKESEAHLVDFLGKEDYKDTRRDNSIRHAVIATWQISFAQIQETKPNAANLLAIMSMFDRQGIPLCLLQEAFDDSRDILDDLLTVLVDFSLVRIEVGKKSAELHRLVQLSMKRWLRHRQKETSPDCLDRQTFPLSVRSRAVSNTTPPRLDYATCAHGALLFMAGVFLVNNFEDRGRCSKYLPHAYAVLKNDISRSTDDLKAKGHLSYHIGVYLRREGRYIEAERYVSKSLILHRAAFGFEHNCAMLSMGLLGSLLHEQRRWKDAEQMFLELLEIQKRVLGELHANTMQTISCLSKVYCCQGRYNEAEDLAVQAFEATRKAFGEDHEETLPKALNLGIIYATSGRLEKAEELILQSVEGYKKAFGEKHPKTKQAMVTLGEVYRDQGRLNEAEELTRRAVRCLEDSLGEDSRITLLAKESLLEILIHQQKLDEAERLGKGLLTITMAAGDYNPETIIIMYRLASIYTKKGQFEKGREALAALLQISKGVFGEEHSTVLAMEGSLAFLYCFLEQYEEAGRLLAHVVEMARRVMGTDHPQTLTHMASLAFIWRECGRSREALAQLRDVIKRRRRLLGRDHPDTVFSLACLAIWIKEEASQRTLGGSNPCSYFYHLCILGLIFIREVFFL